MYKLISRIFDPFVMLVLFLILALRKSTLQDPEQLVFFTVLFISSILMPAGLLLFAIKKKFVRDWDLRRREERPKVLGILFVINILNTVIVKLIGDQFLFNLYIFLLIYLTGFILITLFWKISGHLGINSIVVFFIVHWFGLNYIPLLLIIPLVGWARFAGKFHTPAQIAGGVVYSWVILRVAELINLV
jgi:hypothetical protein